MGKGQDLTLRAGAFGAAFAAALRAGSESGGQRTSAGSVSRLKDKNKIDAAIKAAQDSLDSHSGGWGTEEEAARAFSDATIEFSHSLNVEVAADLYKVGENWFLTPIYTDYQSGYVGKYRDYSGMLATIHTHGARVTTSQYFSVGTASDPGDIEWYISKNIVGWLANPYGELYRFDAPTYKINTNQFGPQNFRSGMYCSVYPDTKGTGCL